MEIFKGTQFTGKDLVCHKDFIPYLKLMNSKAKDLGIQIYVTSSDRNNTNVKGAIVTPAKMSNHLVGHAIDCNLVEKNKWWNSSKLKTPSGNVLIFIDFCTSVGIRWGGTFVKKDTVHFDYPLNLKDKTKYLEILNSKS